MSATQPAIALRGVTKRFGAITAVDRLDLEVPAGICLGLLGNNGAGKSTTMRLLTAQAIADEGAVEVLGHALPRESKAARARSGVVPQRDNLDEELTVAQQLEVFARLYRVPRRERDSAIARALELADLAARADTRIDALSGGMRRRLLIARGLVHRPELLLLDEPTVGLDPQVRQELWSLIVTLRDAGTTVVMSTHYIEEAEELADDVAIMARGRVIDRGAPAALVARHAGAEVRELTGDARALAHAETQARALGLPTRRRGPQVAVLRAEGLDGQLGPGRTRPAVLEDVFVSVTGEEAT